MTLSIFLICLSPITKRPVDDYLPADKRFRLTKETLEKALGELTTEISKLIVTHNYVKLKEAFDRFGSTPTAKEQLARHLCELHDELMKETSRAAKEASNVVLDAMPRDSNLVALVRQLIECCGYGDRKSLVHEYLSKEQLQAVQLKLGSAIEKLGDKCLSSLTLAWQNLQLKFLDVEKTLATVEALKPVLAGYKKVDKISEAIRNTNTSIEQALDSLTTASSSAFYKKPLTLQHLKDNPPKTVLMGLFFNRPFLPLRPSQRPTKKGPFVTFSLTHI